MNPVGYTAYWVAAARARESRRTDALFRDPFADALAGDEGVGWIDEANDDGMVAAYVALRTRFFDDELMHATRVRGIRQVVILAAGLDARAFRLDWPSGTRLFELDQAEVLAHKDAVLAGVAPRCARTALAIDLTRPWVDDLRAHGLDPEERTAWLVEGLLPYLREPEVHALFEQMASLSAIGSTLALDCAGVDFFSTPEFAAQADRMRARGITMQFASERPALLLAQHGFQGRTVSIPAMALRVGRAFPHDPMKSTLVSAVRR